MAAQLAGLLVNLVLINMWEETAWSGVVQTGLERRHGIVAAALLTAVPFALAHMPLHFIGSFSPASLAAALVALLIICALVRIMIGVVPARDPRKHPGRCGAAHDVQPQQQRRGSRRRPHRR